MNHFASQTIISINKPSNHSNKILNVHLLNLYRELSIFEVQKSERIRIFKKIKCIFAL